jgi:hypothetical protein
LTDYALTAIHAKSMETVISTLRRIYTEISVVGPDEISVQF